MHCNNILNNIPESLPEELCELLAKGSGCTLKRIVSKGHTSPECGWYDQTEDEWVLLVSGRATILFEEDNKAKMCMIIKRYYIDKELILYDKYSKNFR